ncbi:MAG TPA: hypothetical protein VI756_31280 [Blastocatellia bacterium]
MRSITNMAIFVVTIGIAAVNSGCSIHNGVSSVSSRIFREVHGLRARSYQITPVTEDLSLYRRVEIHPLQNLMLDQIPEKTVKQLNAEILQRTQSVKRFESVTAVEEEKGAPPAAQDQSASQGDDRHKEMSVEGYIDDYTPGIPALRYIEQGNNHGSLTVRITLKDKETARILGETNITVENTRVTSNVGKMVDKMAEKVAAFVAGTSRDQNRPKEVRAYEN